jgi:hypothetical protein
VFAEEVELVPSFPALSCRFRLGEEIVWSTAEKRRKRALDRQVDEFFARERRA